MFKTVHEMTKRERDDETISIGIRDAAILKTPLISEGAISSTQINRMGRREREVWQANAQRRMILESRIRELAKTDAEIETERQAAAVKEAAEKRERLERDIALWTQVGTSRKTGKVRPSYQRMIDAAAAELAAIPT